MPVLNLEQREPYLRRIQNSVIALQSKQSRKWVHELLTPCDAVMSAFRQRRQPLIIPSSMTPAYYEKHLLEDALYWMDLTLHPVITQTVKGMGIAAPPTIWGKHAFHWLSRGFCYDVRRTQHDRALTEDYYAGWWQDRADGIPSSAFVMLGRTPSHCYMQLKRDYTQLKLLGNHDTRSDRICP